MLSRPVVPTASPGSCTGPGHACRSAHQRPASKGAAPSTPGRCATGQDVHDHLPGQLDRSGGFQSLYARLRLPDEFSIHLFRGQRQAAASLRKWRHSLPGLEGIAHKASQRGRWIRGCHRQPVVHPGRGPLLLYTEAHVDQAANLFLVDMNLDGKADICFWKKGDFIVYPQLDDGGFDTSPVTVRSQVSFDLDGIDGISVRMQDEDQSDRLTTVLHELRDLDGDGITDILTQAIRSKGVFNKKTTVAFHKGFAADNGFVRFDPTASSVIQSKGFQYEMRSRDLNNNGEVDILISSVEIGVTKIIGALLTNSVKIDLGFYEMKQGTYPKTADHVREITAKFSLSTGEFWYPFVRVVDANGDGLDDLLVQRGDDQVLVFVGDADKLFNKTPIKISAPMPKDPDFVSISRLNGDEIEDVVLKIPPDISDSNGSHRIILLLSNHGGALRPN